MERLHQILVRDEEAEQERLRFSELWTVTGDVEENDEFHRRLLYILGILLDTLWLYDRRGGGTSDEQKQIGKLIVTLLSRRSEILEKTFLGMRFWPRYYGGVCCLACSCSCFVFACRLQWTISI